MTEIIPPHAPAIRWATVFDEPYASLDSRLQGERLLAGHLAANPDWLSVWAAGSLHAVAQALPTDDPWRRVAARLTVPPENRVNAHSAIVREPIRPDRSVEAAPTRTGARLDDQTFGSFRNGTDLYDQPLANPWTDPALVVLTGPHNPHDPSPNGPDEVATLDPTSAALIGFAGEPDTTGLNQLVRVVSVVFDTHDPATAVKLWGDALRWVAWRRRNYASNDDEWASGSMLRWVARADSYLADEFDPAEHIRDIRDHAIPRRSYTHWRSYIIAARDNRDILDLPSEAESRPPWYIDPEG